MKKLLLGFAVFLSYMMHAAPAAIAAPRQIVVVVAEGLSPQLVDFGTAYVKTAYEEGTTVAFDTIKEQAPGALAPANALDLMRGVLKTAAANGFKTGLITTESVASMAPLFYDLPQADAATSAATLARETKFDFLSGGGRAAFSADALQALTGAGGTAITDIEGMDAEIKGKTLVLQGDTALNYALDRDIEKEAGLAEMVTLGLQTLGADGAPYVLVIHDTLLARALAARDTPALLEQFRELDGILSDVLAQREENPDDFAMALLATGGTSIPRFSTELPNQRSEAFYIISQLPKSFGAAGASLQGADEAKLTAFATEQYKGWKLTPENRAAITAGTLAPEAALRASYEPALRINYETIAAAPMLHAIGFEGTDIVAALARIVATAPAPATPAPATPAPAAAAPAM